ncbi:sugar phosphate isomerase/epimerase [Lachnospiraceae bacterium PF1-21]|uniref:Sugar phosphate isomerase/epimerase n=1 Tax=Ohessyouella blattaphilus TaxID=2949333 RepID=A0ABT1EH07_9FIRM|nr:sugar phosphate isomerase/epimerase [Ohessyouella blattaphilus]MCP1109991.1 sugar phosphate isomerase/epimerase [Ohessyouella blattaphilus]MCR8563385.1 sugar phosphate isomerase/epimerase [Ohessyouella blattaphilus]MDL2250900.1 sugar phosphate isomerase/epimerase [Lachnospiraceae bacterium OttesenSCG-928-J05]
MPATKLLSSCETDYNNDLHSWIEIEQQIRNLAEAGFTHTQWMQNWEGEYMYSRSEMFQARDVLRHYGICAHSIHATEGGIRTSRINGKKIFQNRYRFTDIRKDYTSTNEYLRLAGVDLLKNRIDLCTYIGASVMVLHMQLPYMMFEEEPEEKTVYYRQVMKSFDEIKEYAKASGVRIALENMICTPQKYQDEQFDLMFDRYDRDFLGFAYDSGHGSLMCREDYYHFLKKYNDRLYATHLQDNASIPDELLYQEDGDKADLEVLLHDSHWVPDVDGTLKRGLLDWDLIAELVATAPLDLPADFEVVLTINEDDPEDEMKQLIHCRKQAELFYQKVLNKK